MLQDDDDFDFDVEDDGDELAVRVLRFCFYFVSKICAGVARVSKRDRLQAEGCSVFGEMFHC